MTLMLLLSFASSPLQANPWCGARGGGGCYPGGGSQYYNRGASQCYRGWNGGGYYRPGACGYGCGYGYGRGYGGSCGSAGGWYGTGIPNGLGWVLCGLGLGGLLGMAATPVLVAPQPLYVAPAPVAYPVGYCTPVY